jgi:hypothetical protein
LDGGNRFPFSRKCIFSFKRRKGMEPFDKGKLRALLNEIPPPQNGLCDGGM